EARADGVRADTLGGVLERGDLGQSDERVLRRDVRGAPGDADGAEHGRHVDDRATAGGEHRGDLVAQAVEHAVEVDRPHTVPGGDVVLADRLRGRTDPGVVH